MTHRACAKNQADNGLLLLIKAFFAAALLLGLVQASQASSRAIPAQPEIRVDQVFFDNFIRGPEQLFPRIEFTGDSMLLFEGPE